MQIPQGHQTVMPYLMLQDAAGFIQFTRLVFDASLTATHLREDNTGIMHAEIQINGCTIMVCDATPQWPAQTANFFIYVPLADDTYKTALQNGAATVMELSDKDYGRTCGVSDPFGNTWWITSVKA